MARPDHFVGGGHVNDPMLIPGRFGFGLKVLVDYAELAAYRRIARRPSEGGADATGVATDLAAVYRMPARLGRLATDACSGRHLDRSHWHAALPAVRRRKGPATDTIHALERAGRVMSTRTTTLLVLGNILFWCWALFG
jgi:hypothetical protein